MKNKYTHGFTLLEFLLIFVAVCILIGIVFFAINPNKELGEARNTKRKVDANQILNAVYQYMNDNNLSAPPKFIPRGTTCGVLSQKICKSGGVCDGLVDLDIYLAGSTSKYIVSIPTDPFATNINSSGYEIYNNNGQITVCAPNAEGGQKIIVTKGGN